DERAVLSRAHELVAQPIELLGLECTMVVAGHTRVERDDPQSADVIDTVLRRDTVRAVAVVLELVEELPSVRRSLVVVPHAPHELCAGPMSDRLHRATQLAIRTRLTEVGEVAGEDDHVRTDGGALELVECRP